MNSVIKLKPTLIDNLQVKKTTNFRAFNEELNTKILLKSFAEKGCCVACETDELYQSPECDCINLTWSFTMMYLRHMLPEYKDRKLQKISNIIDLFLPTSVESMREVISEKNALGLELGKAKVTIEPLEQLETGVEHQNVPLAIYVNNKLVYVSKYSTYSDCANALESYMNSY